MPMCSSNKNKKIVWKKQNNLLSFDYLDCKYFCYTCAGYACVVIVLFVNAIFLSFFVIFSLKISFHLKRKKKRWICVLIKWNIQNKRKATQERRNKTFEYRRWKRILHFSLKSLLTTFSQKKVIQRNPFNLYYIVQYMALLKNITQTPTCTLTFTPIYFINSCTAATVLNDEMNGGFSAFFFNFCFCLFHFTQIIIIRLVSRLCIVFIRGVFSSVFGQSAPFHYLHQYGCLSIYCLDTSLSCIKLFGNPSYSKQITIFYICAATLCYV